ncbi:MAG: hypothetical protein ACHREM_09930 [Polyangiales bacterium]
MGADQIAEMRPIITEVLEGARRGEAWCGTFEVSGDSARWLQVTATELNVAYPSTQPPPELLAQVAHAGARSLTLREWKPRTFATFDVASDSSAAQLGQIADALFQTVLGCDDEYHVDASLVRLDDSN